MGDDVSETYPFYQFLHILGRKAGDKGQVLDNSLVSIRDGLIFRGQDDLRDIYGGIYDIFNPSLYIPTFSSFP